jgi:hypothetical protein
MTRASAAVSPEALRIEDEVWQEAFTRREPPARRALRPPVTAAPASATLPSARSRGVDQTPAERRTIRIQGRGAERNLPWPDPYRRPQRRAYERAGFRPDRVAMWAVLLGLLLMLVAIASAHS